MPLNPYAICFQPRVLLPVLPASQQGQHDVPSGLAASLIATIFEAGSTNLLDLPAEVLQRIVSCTTLVPADVANIALTCKSMLASVSSAGVHVCINGFANAPSASISAAAITTSLHKYASGLISLDLSGLPVDDKEVVNMLRGLPRLQHLKLSSCRKLTPMLLSHIRSMASLCTMQRTPPERQQTYGRQGCAAAHVDLTAHTCSSACNAEGDGERSSQGSEIPYNFSLTQPAGEMINLKALDIQRCFQMTEECLDILLHAAASGHVTLNALAISHLELQDWPAAATNFDGAEIDVLTDPASSTAATAQEDNINNIDDDGEVDASVHISNSRIASVTTIFRATNITMLALNNCSGLHTASLKAIITACPSLQYLMLGGSKLKMNHIDLPSASTGKHRTPVSRDAAALVNVIDQLTQLKVIDLSFFPLPITAFVCEAAETKPNLQVLDFTSHHCVAAALQIWKAISARRESPHLNATSEPSHTMALQMVLRCGVNCSNDARMSPLHVAAELGHAEMVRALITMGGNVNARKKSGAPPLLAAVYHGNLECAKLLLDAGANPQLANTAGDGPLYTAALRGHLPVVRLLLEACAKHGIAWQDPHQYEDSWSPLMAAALADRYEVCSTLLEKAGPEASKIMVTTANRYGQGVLHIAARKGSPKLLRLLLRYASGGACMTADSYGDTPIDVARKNKNMPAMHELQRRMNNTNH